MALRFWLCYDPLFAALLHTYSQCKGGGVASVSRRDSLVPDHLLAL